ncbi:MAG TPA: DUF4268 domain-containing protein [Candidatus Limnocylindrales bacterium]|nr:DUF4268 domain-containing protein [Candidatus Limnocylindrales bacterium]
MEARKAWKNEARDFTPWLAAHLDLLGRALGLELVLEATEVSVGDFHVDIVAQDAASGDRFVIENQLGGTDHSHLGQLVTYTSGSDRIRYVVWIATKFRAEHRQALDWLNAHTIDGVDFFGVELELLQIDESPLAPHFKLVAQPNEWAKSVRQGGPASELGLRYQRFFSEILARYKQLKPHDTSVSRIDTANWLQFASGRPGFGFVWSMANGRRLRVELYIDTGSTSKMYFDALLADRESIEHDLGQPVTWERLDNRRACRLAIYRDVAEPPPFEENQELLIWAVETMAHWTAVLRPRIRALPVVAVSPVSGSVTV